MALETCSDCQGQISSTAPACPHCGKPRFQPQPPAPFVQVQKPERGGMHSLGWGCLIVLGVLVAVFLLGLGVQIG